MAERDEDVRIRCFLALDALRARFGNDLPFVGGLSDGFVHGGKRVPFLNRQKGIYRSAIQKGPAALSIQTSFKSPYGDEETDEGFRYAYRAGDIDQPDNRALRQAHDLRVPLVYFVSTRPSWYRAEYPCYITDDDADVRQVTVTPGRMAGTLEEPQPVPIAISIERKYAVRETRVRLHQGRFRALVLQAYRDRCTICRLRELRLLDAAHIVQDIDPKGVAEIPNGLSLCRFITARTTRTSLAYHPTTRCTSRGACWRTTMARCSMCSKTRKEGRSSCRPEARGIRIARSSNSASSSSAGPRNRSAR